MARQRTLLALLALYCLLPSATHGQATDISSTDIQPYSGFIRVSQGAFVDATCREFKFSGWNGWRLMELATNKVTPPGSSSGQDFIRSLFQRATRLGLNVLRFFLAGDVTDFDGNDQYDIILMPSPGNFSEEAFRGLDFILAEAGKAGLKLVMVPLNMWKQNGGVPFFEKLCGSNTDYTIPRPDLEVRPLPLNETERLQTPYKWYVDSTCRQIYKDYLTAIVNRRNSITGVLYRDDPTIFSWNLMNEPRCKYCGPGVVSSWYADMAQHLKSIDPNHMVTTGEEGFFIEGSSFTKANPDDGNLWGDRTGQDFEADHASPYIDYAVIHMWPDNWRSPPLGLGFARSWIEAHMQAAQQLGKPLVLEEFGKDSTEDNIFNVRDPYFQLAYNLTSESLGSGGSLRGALFWEWDYGTNYRSRGGSQVRESDTTFQNHIGPHSRRLALEAAELHRSSGGYVQGCTPASYSGAGTSVSPSNGADA